MGRGSDEKEIGGEMTYLTQAAIAADQQLLLRVTACAAAEGASDPAFWAQSHVWQLSAQPGWDAAYAYAIAHGVERPGADESVIGDGMILAAVQSLRPPPDTTDSPMSPAA